MRVTVRPLSLIDDDLWQAWCRMQEGNPAQAGPCFRPELFAAVGNLRRDTFVAVIEDGTGLAGLLPFMRDAHWPIARPVPMCDYQAVIAEDSRRLDMNQVLRGAELRAWDFNNLVGAASQLFPRGGWRVEGSPRVNLTGEGLAGYLASRPKKARHRETAKRRRLEREMGPVRFEADCFEPSVLQAILDWKSQRFNQGRPLDSWVSDTLVLLAGIHEPSFSGTLSALYAGDILVAAHFGLRSQGVLHWWFPGFDTRFARHSPGRLLLDHLIAHLEAFGCDVLDLGPGEEQYKLDFHNAMLATAAGRFEVPSAFTLARRTKRTLTARIRSSGRLLHGFGRSV